MQGLAVWDPLARGAAGGSASLVSLWERHGLPVEHVDLAQLRGEKATLPVSFPVEMQGSVPFPAEVASRP